MATPKLPLPDGIETKVFRAITNRLKADPTLSRVVKTWRTFEDDPNDASSPVMEQCPYVRVFPSPNPAQVVSEKHSNVSLTVNVELFVVGTNLDNATNLWSAIRAALFPGDGTMQTTINSVKADGNNSAWTTFTLAQPGYGHILDAAGNDILTGVGKVDAALWVKTGL